MKNSQKEVIESYVQAYNAFDVEGMIKNLDKKVVFENISGGRVDMALSGIEAFKKQAEAAVHYFTQRQQKITSWDFEDSNVTIHIDYSATLAVDLPNGLRKGETLKLGGKSIFKFINNTIIKIQDIS